MILSVDSSCLVLCFAHTVFLSGSEAVKPPEALLEWNKQDNKRMLHPVVHLAGVSSSEEKISHGPYARACIRFQFSSICLLLMSFYTPGPCPFKWNTRKS
ncbi:unnamed protein product [Urochloa humidicola]